MFKINWNRSRFGWVRPENLFGQLVLAAAEAGDTNRLISTLEYVQNINFKDDLKETALHKAAAKGNEDIGQLLLRRGASIEAKNKTSNTPLHLAAQNGHTSMVKLLLEEGASVDAINKYKNTPLHLAIRNSHRNTVELLLEKGASMGAVNRHRNTPLHGAIQDGPHSIAETKPPRRLSKLAMLSEELSLWVKADKKIREPASIPTRFSQSMPSLTLSEPSSGYGITALGGSQRYRTEYNSSGQASPIESPTDAAPSPTIHSVTHLPKLQRTMTEPAQDPFGFHRTASSLIAPSFQGAITSGSSLTPPLGQFSDTSPPGSTVSLGLFRSKSRGLDNDGKKKEKEKRKKVMPWG